MDELTENIQPPNNFISQEQSSSIQDTQFLLKRIDPTVTNVAIRHQLMGEIFFNGSWKINNMPSILDKEIIGDIMALIEPLANPELRLSDYTRDDVMLIAEQFGEELTDLLFFKGNVDLKDPVEAVKHFVPDWKTKQLTMMNMQFLKPIVLSLSEYVRGNLARAINGQEGKAINKTTSYIESTKSDNANSFLAKLGMGGN